MGKDTLHNFDLAMQLTEKDGVYYGETSKEYENMVGPYGGLTAATLLKSAINHPDRIGTPISLTVNYAAPVADGPFLIKAIPVRTNRSTQHWDLKLLQKDQVVTSGTAVFAKRRETWTNTELTMPSVPNPEELERFSTEGFPQWTRNYNMKYIEGTPNMTDEDSGEIRSSTTKQWIKDEPDRPLDFLSLTSICDIFIPRIFLRRQRRVPAGTVSLTIYFHTDEKTLTKSGTKEVLGHARGQRFFNGFFDQTAEVWSKDGELLATTSQIVYYRE